MWWAALVGLVVVTQPGGDPAAPRKKAKIRVVEVAARAADDDECEKNVTALARSSEPAGWSLLLACVDQDKYRDLRALVSGPWKSRFAALGREDRLRMAVHVISTGGASFADAMPTLAESQLPVRVLGVAMKAPRHAPDNYVVFRGQLKKRRLEPSGTILLTIAELSRITVDNLGLGHAYLVGTSNSGRVSAQYLGVAAYKRGSNEGWSETGRVARAHVDELPLLPREGNDYAFLAILERVDDDVAEVRIIDIFKPGVILLDPVRR